MAKSVLELAVGTGQWDAGLKKAKSALDNFTQANGGLQQALDKESQKMQKFVQMMGQMDSTAKTAKGQMNDYKATIEQLTMQYNRMSEAQKKTIGQDYLNSIDQIKEKFRQAKAEMEGINKSLGDMKMPDMKGGGFLSGIGDKMSGALQVFGGNLMTKGAGMLAGLASEMGDMVKQGVELAKQGEGIRIAFERLGRGDILDGLRQATHGTVTDIELMKAAVKFNDFKLPLDELGTMLAFAQQKAKDTGQSVDYMVDSIVTGLGRKSLMILDNLGLSATEVKDKMAETGDMTKAVGAIIREQMAKAGDYVETAADRATKANVELTNAMTGLGNTLQPLTDASNSLWNSIKVGALNALNTAVKPLIQALSEAGALGQGARSTAGFNRLGGGSKVDRMIGRLGNGKSAGAYSIYQQQLGEFDKYINNKRFQIAAYGGDNSSVAKSAKAKLQTELDGALKMREEYVKRAQELHNKVPSPYEPTASGVGGGGRSGGGKGSNTTSEVTYASDSIVAQQKLVQDLTKQWNESGASVRDKYLQPLVEAEAKLKSMQNEMGLQKENAAGKLLGNTPDGKAVEIPISSDIAFETWMTGIQEKLSDLKLNPIEIPIETTTKDVKAIAKAASMTADVVGSIGDAFNAIEDPAAKVMGTIAQAVASVALGYAQATVAASQTGNPWVWAAFAVSGLATMITMISQIHSSTGYAQGGVINGNSYSGDNIGGMVDGGAGGFVGLNAGEVVLNAAQQRGVANALSEGGNSRIEVFGRLSGETIFLSSDRYTRRTGRGTILTWK